MKWCITLRPEYAEAIIEGTKRFEIRTRVPRKLSRKDKIYVCLSGTGGRVAFSFEVKMVLRCTPEYLWGFHCYELGISQVAFWDYVGERREIYAIEIENVIVEANVSNIVHLGLKRAPQWFTKIFY